MGGRATFEAVEDADERVCCCWLMDWLEDLLEVVPFGWAVEVAAAELWWWCIRVDALELDDDWLS